ncbi:MAG: DUF58 domain-containing protein [Litorilituus sp.]|jgi:uncharacterized protein (DUF58 family)|nr:DUF58 domain-containing protein [Litorilituus sp.]
MWFKNTTAQQNKAVSTDSCLSQLNSIHSNGVKLTMAELLYYQNKTALIDLSARKNIHGQMSGNYLSRTKGRGMEFDEVRHYQTGDDIRAIDWRVTARTGKTHTKLFREELERPVLIATDLSSSMHFGSQLLFKSVQAAHLSSLVAWHAKNRGDRLGGIVFNQREHVELKPRSRKEGVLHYLHAMMKLHTSQHQTQYTQTTQQTGENFGYFSDNCARIRQIAKPGSLVYLITDAQALKTSNKNSQKDNYKHDALRHLSQISQHCELVVCLINDPLEQALPSSNIKLNVNLTDGENRQQLTLGDKETASNYKHQAGLANSECQQALIKAGARVIYLSAGQTLEQQLKNGEQFCKQ